MKFTLKIIACLLLAGLAVGCGGDDEKGSTPVKAPDGWMLTKWKGSTAMSGKVYVEFLPNATFRLYQSIDSPGFQTLEGSYQRTQDAQGREILSGTYTGEIPWSDSYVVDSWTDKELILQALSDGAVSEYAATVIPDLIRQEQPEVRSAEPIVPFL